VNKRTEPSDWLNKRTLADEHVRLFVGHPGPRCPACKGEHPIFDRKFRFHPKHTLEKPTFGPILPPAIAREKRAKEKAIEERRKGRAEADESMVDA
jgi:hypothetical protein